MRHENGLRFTEIEKGFKSGRYRFNNRVRDRDFFLVDEQRQIVMARGSAVTTKKVTARAAPPASER